MAVTYMTEEGYKKLIDQIKQLESVERPRISAQIAEARDKGDLSENAEYDAAKEAQGLLEMKIAQLKDTLANARILDESMVSADSVQILSKVRVKDQKSGREMNYMLVSENEANIREGKLAVTTPIAKALMGKKVGDVAEAKVPAGTLMLEILEISI
ncbi:MAG: transcription elongation factor GreA [Paludibacteraceae bacterium]|jgi:transcription elongation factor GreA|nr:transcription elongation factor GreA [Paludibacteraceae bacterium]MBR5189627.1 transcription elongation factor GreA [Paludibacteraceae bacterium]MBR5238695.1 transcription elongation factor GreA [Paludibacteraceae bacterium]MBR5824024.1 transcription elongation factor GreA [Paludibacteraceae bacterium]MBR6521015.1 transcription elongation factor GreA [Paludibacteraceae bacterium]